jgi:mRNA interferase RelE/StbE
MSYEIIFKQKIRAILKKLDNSSRIQIIKKIGHLGENPYLGKPLTSILVGSRSLRIGKYRVIYKIVENKLIVIVLDIGHRKSIY